MRFLEYFEINDNFAIRIKRLFDFYVTLNCKLSSKIRSFVTQVFSLIDENKKFIFGVILQ